LYHCKTTTTTKKVSYIIYLSEPDEGWKKQDGGNLEVCWHTLFKYKQKFSPDICLFFVVSFMA